MLPAEEIARPPPANKGKHKGEKALPACLQHCHQAERAAVKDRRPLFLLSAEKPS